jgi:hypothetical protein
MEMTRVQFHVWYLVQSVNKFWCRKLKEQLWASLTHIIFIDYPDTQCMDKGALWRVRVIIVVIEAQQCVPLVLLIYKQYKTAKCYHGNALQSTYKIFLAAVNNTNIIMSSPKVSDKFLSDFNQIWSLSTHFHKVACMKSHENPSSGSGAVICGQTDRLRR